MSLIPDDIFKKETSINLAPMVDFLFLIGAIFAVLAMSRTALVKSDLNLVQLRSPLPEFHHLSHQEANTETVHVNITKEGQYQWVNNTQEIILTNLMTLKQELLRSRMENFSEKPLKILLHIDQEAQWEPITQAIFTLKELGFPIYPVYKVH